MSRPLFAEADARALPLAHFDSTQGRVETGGIERAVLTTYTHCHQGREVNGTGLASLPRGSDVDAPTVLCRTSHGRGLGR